MATGTQPQTAWALWTRDFAETLETCLAELKHQGEPKVQHSKPLDHGRLLHFMIYQKNSCSHPISLPNHCYILLGSLHWASAPHWILALQGSLPLRSPTLGPCQIPAPLGSLPLSPARNQLHVRQPHPLPSQGPRPLDHTGPQLYRLAR
jgi:hypothetical protein